MSVLPIIAARKSEDTITVIPGDWLSFYPITEWDIRVIIVLWILFFITLIFVVLRFYSRLRILQFYALEDHLYNVAFVRPILFSSCFPSPLLSFFFFFFGSLVCVTQTRPNIPCRESSTHG